MGAHQQEPRALQDENHRLRKVVEAQQRGMEQMEATLQPNLRGGNPTGLQKHKEATSLVRARQ